MFTSSVDVEAGAMVWLLSGKTNADRDWQRLLDTLKFMDETFAERAVAILSVVDPENPVAPPPWRTRIVRATMSVRSKPAFAHIIGSTLGRVVMNGLRSSHPPPYEQEIVHGFEQAMAWLSERRDVDRSTFERLREAARAEAERPSNPARSRIIAPSLDDTGE